MTYPRSLLHEPSPYWAGMDGGFNREAGRRAVLTVRRVAAAGTSVLGPGILTWLLLRKGRARRRDQA